jgi:hypothetical protein
VLEQKAEEFAPEVKEEEVLLPPSEKQSEAIDFLVNAIENREHVVGFIAPGGCGKTFSLKHIRKDPRLAGIPLTFTATTNKAASVMKTEGLKGAKTLHAAISKHVSTRMYQNMENLFKVHYKNPDLVQELPNDVIDFLEEIGVPENKFFHYKDEKELIAENGVDSYDDRIFSHYATAEYEGGVCFLDEASMLPTKSQYQKDPGPDGKLKLKTIGLDVVKKVYDTVVLVGDDSQLPPINGDSSFADIPKVSLTENFRADKGLLRVLEYVRNGGNIGDFVPKEGENVRIVASVGPEYFVREDLIKNKVTHIVYKNKTRKEITHQVRAELSADPVLNEPIVYKGANIDNPNDSISKNETGFFNGMMGEWENHSQVTQGKHFDEYGTGFTYLQYAYAITAHTAQGSSFDYVVVHNDDVPHFIDAETKRKWLYTAISRARKGIVVVY